MLSSGIVWRSSCGDAFSVFAYDNDKYDAIDILSEMTGDFLSHYRVIEEGDTLEFVTLEEEPAIKSWVASLLENTLEEDTMALVSTRECIYEEKDGEE